VTRLLLLLLAASLSTGCAAIARVTSRASGNSTLVRIQEGCDAFSARPITYEEEYQIGGAVALALARNTQHGFLLDAPPELQHVKQLDPKTHSYQDVTAPGTPKNELNTYLNLVGKNLAAASERAAIRWTFAALDDPTPNAFSAPGGYVFVTRGLLARLESEAQLAAVLAHEIGHVVGRHALNAYKGAKVSSCNGWVTGLSTGVIALNVAGSRGGSGLAQSLDAFLSKSNAIDSAAADIIEKLTDSTADTLLKNGYGKDDEYEADATAFELLLFTGYDPRALEGLLSKLDDGGRLFANHPSNAQRREKLREVKGKLEQFPLEGGAVLPQPPELSLVRPRS
jgi:Zn-dependent protease with chaperone function